MVTESAWPVRTHQTLRLKWVRFIAHKLSTLIKLIFFKATKNVFIYQMAKIPKQGNPFCLWENSAPPQCWWDIHGKAPMEYPTELLVSKFDPAGSLLGICPKDPRLKIQTRKDTIHCPVVVTGKDWKPKWPSVGNQLAGPFIGCTGPAPTSGTTVAAKHSEKAQRRLRRHFQDLLGERKTNGGRGNRTFTFF